MVELAACVGGEAPDQLLVARGRPRHDRQRQLRRPEGRAAPGARAYLFLATASARSRDGVRELRIQFLPAALDRDDAAEGTWKRDWSPPTWSKTILREERFVRLSCRGRSAPGVGLWETAWSEVKWHDRRTRALAGPGPAGVLGSSCSSSSGLRGARRGDRRRIDTLRCSRIRSGHTLEAERRLRRRKRGRVVPGALLAGDPQHVRSTSPPRSCSARDPAIPSLFITRRNASRPCLLVLIFVPFWVSYLMRMLGLVAGLDGLHEPGARRRRHRSPPEWLNGNSFSVIAALTYGYIPYFILPVSPASTASTRAALEAARDLGASSLRTFLRVTLPMSWLSILAEMVLITLPMFGDSCTNDLMLRLAARQHARRQPSTCSCRRAAEEPRGGDGPGADGAACDRHALLPLGNGAADEEGTHMSATAAANRPAAQAGRAPEQGSGLALQPVGAPALPGADHLALHRLGARPGALRGRLLLQRRALAQRLAGLLDPLVVGATTPSRVFHDPTYTNALTQSLKLAALDVAIAAPLGILLAIGLARWRGRGSGPPTS